jgi:hypothetical protein
MLDWFVKGLFAAFGIVAMVPAFRPVGEVTGAGIAAMASVATAQVKTTQSAEVPVEQPPAEKVAPAPPSEAAAPDKEDVKEHVVTKCCQDCTCDQCQCEYPGQCLLKAAGKHILWIHDPSNGSWRGYASPHCKDVREIDPTYHHPTYNAMKKLVPPAKKIIIRQGGGCANGVCR